MARKPRLWFNVYVRWRLLIFGHIADWAIDVYQRTPDYREEE